MIKECFFKYKWTPTHLNLADGITREDPNNDMRLSRSKFLEVNEKYGPFHTDLMASPANVQKGANGENLPFYSQYYTETALATYVFSVNVRYGSGAERSGQRACNYCFPPLGTMGLLVEHLRDCKAK